MIERIGCASPLGPTRDVAVRSRPLRLLSVVGTQRMDVPG
jgi:hypothetical protein